MDMNQIKTILSFMQRHDPNGMWMEWFNEIKEEESTFDKEYVLEILEKWFLETNEEIYITMYATIKNL